MLEYILALFLFFVGLGLGSTLSPIDFHDVIKNKKKAIIIGWLSQFGFMPLISFIFAHIFNMGDLVAIGAILVGSSPGGTTSNLFTYWTKGDVALSITMSVASTICATFMMPLLIIIYIYSSFISDGISIAWDRIFLSLILVVIPCCIGIYIRKINTNKKIKDKYIWEWIEKIGSILGGFFLIGAIIYGIIEFDEIFSSPIELWIAALLMEPLGALFGYTIAKKWDLTNRDARTISLETGVQNSSLTIAIVSLSFDGDEEEKVLTFPLLYSLCYLINSAWLVLFFKYYLIPKDNEILNDDDDDDSEIINDDDNNINNKTNNNIEKLSKNTELTQI